MKNQRIKRREFLKNIGGFLMGAVIVRMGRIFRFYDDTKQTTPPTREARYYTSGDELAG